MNTSTSRLAAIALLTAIASGPAAADTPELVDATMPEKIVEIAKGFGAAELGQDTEGDPFITGRMDGNKYQITFYGCSEGKRCQDIQFVSGWTGAKVTLEQLNAWNSSKRYGKTYLDQTGDPMLGMSVNLDHGVTKDNLDDTFAYWNRVVKQYLKEVLGQ